MEHYYLAYNIIENRARAYASKGELLEATGIEERAIRNWRKRKYPKRAVYFEAGPYRVFEAETLADFSRLLRAYESDLRKQLEALPVLVSAALESLQSSVTSS